MTNALYEGNHPDIANSLNNLGTLYFSLRKYLKAKEYYEKALFIYRNHYSNNHPVITDLFSKLRLLYFRFHNFKDAKKHFT